MSKLALPHDAFVFVGDGRKALFLRNAGDAKFPNLVTEHVFAEANPATHDQGSDRPGRSEASAHSSQRSAMEPTDWHEIERFVSVTEVVEPTGSPAYERNYRVYRELYPKLREVLA